MDIKIKGTGSAVPRLKVTNEDLSNIMDTSDEWIRSRTGIGARHIAVEETTTSLAVAAAQKALLNAGIVAEDLDLILAATVSPDKFFPNLACEVQSALGAKNAVAFDISAACSGFLFCMNTARMYLENGKAQNALILGAETLSKMMDWNDRSTCVLFGDGAGAAVLCAQDGEEKEGADGRGSHTGTAAAVGNGGRPEKKTGILNMVWGSDGAQGMVLNCANRPVNNPYVKNDTALSYTAMNGQEVYKFAVRKVPEIIHEVVEGAGLAVEDIDLFLLHQANYRIIEAVAKRLKQPLAKFPTNLQEYGNISAASVPILLDNVNNHGMINAGNKIVMAGFGAGLTWGAAVLEW